jgi:hypothetical protein
MGGYRGGTRIFGEGGRIFIFIGETDLHKYKSI